MHALSIKVTIWNSKSHHKCQTAKISWQINEKCFRVAKKWTVGFYAGKKIEDNGRWINVDINDLCKCLDTFALYNHYKTLIQ